MDITAPTDVKVLLHITIQNGMIVGMPPVWGEWLSNSDIRLVVASICLRVLVGVV